MFVLQAVAGFALAVAIGGGARRIEAALIRQGVPHGIARYFRYACWVWAAFTVTGAVILLIGNVTGLAPT